jgi:hypothetical protein
MKLSIPFLFPDGELTGRIERAEADFMASCASVAKAGGQRAVVLPLAGGVAVFSRAGSPTNKAIGVALNGGFDTAELANAESALRERGESLRIELATTAHPSAGQQLSELGYRLEGFENVLGRHLSAVGDAPPPAIDVERVESLDPWMDVLIRGFSRPDGTSPVEEYPRDLLEQAIGDVARVDGLARYVARLEGRLAGAASMRIHDGVAILSGASTLFESRRRGVQGALLQARLADARFSGADVAIITTAPGSRSHANAIRHGFTLLFARAILVSRGDSQRKQ